MRFVSGVVVFLAITAVAMTSLRAGDNILGLPDQAVITHGSLVIVGGGRTTDPIREEFVRLAGGPRARVVLIPSACSACSLEHIEQCLSVWQRYSIASLDYVNATSREQADSAEFVRPLEQATGVWMPGGYQGRLTELYGGTLVEQAIRQVLERGGVVGGTSAGAAVMSQVMILEGTTCEAITSRGFGFLQGAVVDQHFSQRGRHARLLQVLDDHPGLLGLGVDESTALIVRGNRLRVLGESRVTVCVPAPVSRATLVYRLAPNDEVELTLAAPATDVPVRVALRKPAG